MKLHQLATSLFTLALLLTTPALARDIEKRANVDADGRVAIINVAGSVEVTGNDGNEVVLTGTLSEFVERLDFDASSGDVRIEVVYADGRSSQGRRRGDRDMDSHLKLQVPRGVDLRVETVSANIDVHGHDGAQDLHSVSGDIDARLGRQRASVESVSGNIELQAQDAEIELTLETVSGDVTLVDFHGDVNVDAVSGDVELRNAALTRASIDCISGDIEVAGRLKDSAQLEIETISGDVALALDEGVDAQFRIDTHSGDIDSFFGNEAQRMSQYGPGERLSFRVGGGHAEVRVSTMSGDVRNRGAGS
jgi:DUF4097 and DUF4098 domain-containing protein YvlB